MPTNFIWRITLLRRTLVPGDSCTLGRLWEVIGEKAVSRTMGAAFFVGGEDMDEAIESLKRRLEIHRRNLSTLEERAASFGSLDVPLKLINQIEFEKEEIARLEEKMAGLAGELKSLYVKKDSVPKRESARAILRGPTGQMIRVLAKIRVDPLSKVLVALFGVLLLFTIVQASVFYPPVTATKVKTDPAGMSYAAKYPGWIAVGDVEEFTITLINSGSEVLTDVNAFLVFTDTLHVSTDEKSGNKAEFGELAVNERKTRSIRFLLDRAEAKSPLKAELQVVSKELGEKTLDTCTFNILPIRNYKSIFQKLVAFVLLAVSSISAFIGKEALKALQVKD